MPDLRNSPIIGSNGRTFGDNYQRASQKFSNFGTRRLRFYTIEVDGYNLYTEDETGEYETNFGTTAPWPEGDDGNYGYKNQPRSMVEAILRGVSLVAEIYYVSWYNVEFDGEYPISYITVAVAGDTFLDGQNQGVQTNQNSYRMVNAIVDALGSDFNWDDVYVYPVEIEGRDLQTDNNGNALVREPRQMTDAGREARNAAINSPKVQRVSRNG